MFLLHSILKKTLGPKIVQSVPTSDHLSEIWENTPPGTRRCCAIESTSMTLIQCCNNVVCPVGYSTRSTSRCECLGEHHNNLKSGVCSLIEHLYLLTRSSHT